MQLKVSVLRAAPALSPLFPAAVGAPQPRAQPLQAATASKTSQPVCSELLVRLSGQDSKQEPCQQFVLIPENISYIFQRKKPPKSFQPSQVLERLRAGHFVSTKAPSASHQLAELYRTNSLGQDPHSVWAPTPARASLLDIHLFPVKMSITYSNHLLPIHLLKYAHCLRGLS